MKVMEENIFQLKITLKSSKPPIWRRVLVKNSLKLEDLHYLIQSIFENWDNSHLHVFIVGKETYGNSEDDDYDENEVILLDVLPEAGNKMSYIYDFGDNWDHEIVLEKVLKIEKGQEYPICIDGKRACPYEDSGGVWGYESKLEITKDPKHACYKEVVEWMNEGDFDPEYFDLEKINKQLRRTFK